MHKAALLMRDAAISARDFIGDQEGRGVFTHVTRAMPFGRTHDSLVQLIDDWIAEAKQHQLI
jgi:hypothetical protein